MDQLKERHRNVGRHINLINEYCLIKYDETQYKNYWIALTGPREVKRAINQGKKNVQQRQDVFRSFLQRDKENFNHELQTIQDHFNKIKSFNDTVGAKQHASQVLELGNNIQSASNKIIKFNQREQHLDMKKTQYQKFKQLKDEFQPFYQLWTMCSQIQSLISDWSNANIKLLQHQRIVQKVDQWLSLSYKLNKNMSQLYPDAADIAKDLRTKVQAFNIYLPVIRALTSVAMADQDWKDLAEVINVPILATNQQCSLNNLLQKNIMQNMQHVQQINQRAQKKYLLQIKLDQMNKAWEHVQISLHDYNKTETKVIKGYDQIQQIVDQQIVTSQAMLGSQYMKGKLKNK